MDELVGSLEELQEFDKAQPAERRPTPALRGILAEIATTGLVRYEWKYLQTLVVFYMDQVLLDYEAESQVEVGPQKPLPSGEEPAILRHRLRVLLADQFPTEAPFTIQRIAELLLEPHKHYSRLDKLALALEKLIMVTSTVSPARNPPPRAKLKDLPPVNINPRNPSLQDSKEDKQVFADGYASPSHHTSGSGAGEGFGLASAVLASTSRDLHHNQQGNAELEEGMGHLNEAGVASRAAPSSPLRDQPVGNSISLSAEQISRQQDVDMAKADPP